MSVTTEDVRRVAALARLDLSTDEEVRLTDELGRILKYMEKLNELDTEGVEPTSHVVPITNAFRPDEVESFTRIEALLEAAAEKKEGYFKVPKIIE